MIVKQILAAKGGDIVNIEPTATLTAAITLLAERRIGALLVLGADRRIVGILSERDIVRVLAERGPSVLHEPVGQFMTRNVTTCSEDETISNIMELMTTGKFRHLPVVDQGRVVGLISIGDVVKHRVQEIEHESEALQDYIRTA